MNLAIRDFALSAHRGIFAQILECSEENEAFDISIVCEELRQRGQLDLVGGVSYVTDLTSGVVPRPELVRAHVGTLLRLSSLRRVQKISEFIDAHVTDLGADPSALLDKIEKAVQSERNSYDLDGNLWPVAGPSSFCRRPDLLTLSQVEARGVDWLWDPYLANGMLAMLSGDPGAGKTFITLAIAAAATVGRTPYDGVPRAPAHVLYLSVENSPEHVLRPRFDALDGNPSLFHILRGSVTGKGQAALRGSVKLSDVELLGDSLQQTRAHLVIVDPIQSYLGADVDAHRSNETRPLLDGLARLAEEHKCCVLLVRHLSKAPTGRAIHRGLGSIDLTGAVRTELLAGSSPENAAQRALVQVKSNLGRLGPSLGYTIDADGSFRWTGESELTASAILSPEATEEGKTALSEAADFLRQILADGPKPSREVQDEARQFGISSATLRRAMSQVGVRKQPDGLRGKWYVKMA